MRKFFYALVAFSVCISCQKKSPTKTTERQFYIASVIDASTQKPFHEILLQYNDSLVRHKLMDNKKVFSNENIDDLEIDEKIKFKNGEEFTFLKNPSFFEELYSFYDNNKVYRYVKAHSIQSINSSQFLKLVNGKYFKAQIDKNKVPNSALDIFETVKFNNHQMYFFWDYYYEGNLLHRETEIVEYRFVEIEDQLFIMPSTKENPYPLYHITVGKAEEIQLNYFIDFETKSKVYRKIDPIKEESYSNYNLCVDHFQRMYYNQDEVRYSRGLDYLTKQFANGAPKSEFEGLITVHFTINCEGNVGRFGLNMLDKNYQPINFEPQLIKHVFEKIKELNDWDNIDKVNFGGARDVKKFYVVKVKNHKIVDLCP